MQKQKPSFSLSYIQFMCIEINVVDILRIFEFQIGVGEMMAIVVVELNVVVGFFVRMMVITVLVVVDI